VATFVPRTLWEKRSAFGRALWNRPGERAGASPVILRRFGAHGVRSDFPGFSLALRMPLPVNILLSRLQPLSTYLVQGVDIDSGLMDALEEVLDRKQLDNVVKLLDKLLEHPLGARVLVLTMTYLLDEWMREGDDRLTRGSRDLDPYAWLATSDHLEVVQTFRELL
jgi:hypothetical protein